MMSMRLKSLPSLKEKKRYVVFKVHATTPLDYYNVKGAVWNALSNWLGESSLAAANVRVIKNLWSQQKQTGYLQCHHKAVDAVKMGLALIHQIGDERVIFQVMRVSGTIKSAKGKTTKGK